MRGNEADDSVAPVTLAPRRTYCACLQRTRSSVKAETGHTSSDGVHARPLSAGFRHPRRLCTAYDHSLKGWNLPRLSGPRILQGRPARRKPQHTKRARRDLEVRPPRRGCIGVAQHKTAPAKERHGHGRTGEGARQRTETGDSQKVAASGAVRPVNTQNAETRYGGFGFGVRYGGLPKICDRC